MADLRYIQIPKGVTVDGVKFVWSFLSCVVHVVDSHPSFNQSGTGVRAGARILDLLDGKKEGDEVVLDQADWKLLNAAFESPASGYIPPLFRKLDSGETQSFNVPARVFLPYIEAVSDDATKPRVMKTSNGVEPKALPEVARA